MILDLLQMTGERFSADGDTLGAFEVAQYIELAEEVELHMAMGSDFDAAVSLALQTSEVM